MQISPDNTNRSELELFHSGENYHAYRFMGAHKMNINGQDGLMFRTWAPNAKSVSVVGDFNDWDRTRNWMHRISDAGAWECFIPGLTQSYMIYKYSIETYDGSCVLKSDPYAYHFETRPNTASEYVDIDGYEWHDAEWAEYKKAHESYSSPMNIYELHAGSWRKYKDGNYFSYSNRLYFNIYFNR